MRWNIQLLSAGFLYLVMLPASAWGYGFNDYPGSRGYHPYPGSMGVDRHRRSIRLQKGMTAEGYYVRVHLDGVQPDDVKVYLRRNRLVLETAQGARYGHHRPDARGVSQMRMRFRRQLHLPYDADPGRMEMTTEDGVIEILIPRRGR